MSSNVTDVNKKKIYRDLNDFIIKMPKKIPKDARKIILNTMKYLNQRKDEGLNSIPLKNVLQLVTDMTGTDSL